MACLGCIYWIAYSCYSWLISDWEGNAYAIPSAMLVASVERQYYGRAFGETPFCYHIWCRGGDHWFWIVEWISYRHIFSSIFVPALLASLSFLFWAVDPRGALLLTHMAHVFSDFKQLPRNFFVFLGIIALFGLVKVHPIFSP